MIDSFRSPFRDSLLSQDEVLSVGAGLSWNPLRLGNKLLAWWDASYGVTLAGNQITSWADRKAGLVVAQPTSSARPSLGVGAFPSLVFDGNDDYLELAAHPFPIGSSPVELWGTLQQSALDTDTTVRYAMAYGGVNASTRRLGKTTRMAMNRAEVSVGDGAAAQYATALTQTFNSRHAVRAAVGATTTSLTLDGVTSAPTAVVPSTGVSRFVFGCAPASNSNYWFGRIRDGILTLPLTPDEAARLQTFIMGRRAL